MNSASLCVLEVQRMEGKGGGQEAICVKVEDEISV